MTAEQFTYWLQGFMETAEPKKLNEKQTKIIKDHLALVFTKVTPNYTPDFSKFKYQDGIRDFTVQPVQPSEIQYPIFPNQTIC